MWKAHVTSGDGTVAQTLNLPKRYQDFLVSNVLHVHRGVFSTHSNIFDGIFL